MLVNDEIKSMQAKTDDGKDAAAVSLGRRGGKARSEKLSPSQRTSIAKQAADKRWKKQR